MDNQNHHESFTYTYSARQQEELKRIRRKYLPPEEDKMAKLIRLDRSAAQKGNVAALASGIIGLLFLGIGMCCVLVWEDTLSIPGIFIGAAGIVLLVLANPLYKLYRKEGTGAHCTGNHAADGRTAEGNRTVLRCTVTANALRIMPEPGRIEPVCQQRDCASLLFSSVPVPY